MTARNLSSFPLLLLLPPLVFGDAPATTWKFEAAALGGYHGNPRYVSPEDSLLRPSPVLVAQAAGQWRYRPAEAWELRSGLEGEAYQHPSAPDGNIKGFQWNGDSRFFPGRSYGKKKSRRESHVGLGLRLDATDNAILSNPDRSDPEAATLGRMESRVRVSGGLPAGTFGSLEAHADWAYRDFSESPFLLASLDSRQADGEVRWSLPAIGLVTPEFSYAVESRQYLFYPARDLKGDTVSEARKAVFSHGPGIQMEIALARKADLKLDYSLEIQRDRYQGYFDGLAHSPGASFRYQGDGKWTLSLKAWSTLEFYDHYRVGYNARKPLKRIRYDFLRTDVQWPLGRFYLRGEALYRGEENNTPAYRFSAPQVFAGFGFRT